MYSRGTLLDCEEEEVVSCAFLSLPDSTSANNSSKSLLFKSLLKTKVTNLLSSIEFSDLLVYFFELSGILFSKTRIKSSNFFLLRYLQVS